MRTYIYTILFFIGVIKVCAQPYSDYIGAGHAQGVTVTSSSNFNATSTAVKSINGSGLESPFFEASRFLAQSTLGADSSLIEEVKSTGFEAWINDQFTKNPTLILPQMNSIWTESKAARVAAGQNPDDIFGPYGLHFNYAWWQVNMTNHMPGKNKDLLRQRIALALSEILVISQNSELGSWGEALSGYYDILLNNSFGNYKQLLKDVSKSFQMGYYLSHLNNPKTDLVNNIRPDENYAREIMQLFTIGLFKLNPDGTEVLDQNGFPIPTYDNDDIKQMAKIFTGLHGSEVLPCPDPPYPPQCVCWSSSNPTWCDTLPNTCCWWPTSPEFGLNEYVLVRTAPLIMDNNNHEPGPKLMPDKTTVINIPGNGMAEVDAAIDWLFNHANTPPFISYRLIQRLVKSNPSPQYVQRVANKFINNGSGVRGDMKAVIKAILMDDEARKGDYMNDFSNGMLRNPTLRQTQFCKANDLDSDMGRYWNHGFDYKNGTGHAPLYSPTVFNFYTPFYAPNGDIKDAGLVAPEFKIQNTSSSINYLNFAHDWTSPWLNFDNESGWVMYSWEDYNGRLDSIIHLNTSVWENMHPDNEKVINEMNKILAHGQLSDNTIGLLRNIATTIDNDPNSNDPWWKRHKLRLMLYFLLISPEFNILR